MSSFLFTLLLAIHVISGGTSLLVGTIVLSTKKGNHLHKKLGKMFFIGMLLAAFSALILSILHPNYFLFAVGIFSLFLVLTGFRFVQMPKQLQKHNRVGYLDWIIVFSMGVFALAFLIKGILMIGSGQSFGWVLLVFGGISTMMLRNDVQIYRGMAVKNPTWIALHLQRMTGAYIASATAFLVVNNTLLPNIIAWLLPTALFTPLIFYWSKKLAKN